MSDPAVEEGGGWAPCVQKVARFLLPQLLLLLLSALVFWLVFDFTELDQWLLEPWFDRQLGLFPLKESDWLELINHKGAKYLVILAALVLLVFAVTGRPRRYAAYRRDALFLLAAMGLSTTLVSLLKAASLHSCPWSLQMYGGEGAWFGVLQTVPESPGPGHCFPGGHASAGFALSAFYFPLRRGGAGRARLALAAAFGYGMLMGWGQMVRGAHFLSHNLWSAWVVWGVVVLVAAAFYACAADREPGRGR